jgi:hypothetical protein
MRMGFYPRVDQFPRRAIETGNLEIPLWVRLTSQEVVGVRQECTVDERQPDATRLDQRLADTRADRSTTLSIVINYTVSPDSSNRIRRYVHDNPMDLEQDIQLVAREMAKKLFNIPGTDHRSYPITIAKGQIISLSYFLNCMINLPSCLIPCGLLVTI